MDDELYSGVDEDDNQNDAEDSGQDIGDDGNLDQDQVNSDDDTDGNYTNSAGKYDDQNGTGAGDVTQEEADEHRNAVGSLVQSLQSRGIDVDSLAQEAGISSADVSNMQDDDVLSLSKYIAQNHPELTQQVFSRFPLAQGLLSRFLG